MVKVILHVYHGTKCEPGQTSNTVMKVNRMFKDIMGIGGIFHSAVQVYGDVEWSFGFGKSGSGVFRSPAGKNSQYTHYERIVLGETDISKNEVNHILVELISEWPAATYDLLARNCNHFCNELCGRFGVPKPPGWINRFANAGHAATKTVVNTSSWVNSRSSVWDGVR
ncbi:hypothetical protein SAY87_001463 [Trapa incisa]|uniref:PPPDE domain-containing protein n=1 Tax=Trapa incisa TaxID=236973 RepID=A0AAN7GPK5_9MYRT|nr:hypothetical protein SAY87_001463 [Trapa incisa]